MEKVTAEIGLLETFLSLLASLVDMSSSQTDLDYYVQLLTTQASQVVTTMPVSWHINTLDSVTEFSH